jgi:hypothetical protein
MQNVVYVISAVLMAAASLIVFRILVRNDYQRRGKLSPLSAFLELLIWGLYIAFPYLYNPPE